MVGVDSLTNGRGGFIQLLFIRYQSDGDNEFADVSDPPQDYQTQQCVLAVAQPAANPESQEELWDNVSSPPHELYSATQRVDAQEASDAPQRQDSAKTIVVTADPISSSGMTLVARNSLDSVASMDVDSLEASLSTEFEVGCSTSSSSVPFKRVRSNDLSVSPVAKKQRPNDDSPSSHSPQRQRNQKKSKISASDGDKPKGRRKSAGASSSKAKSTSNRTSSGAIPSPGRLVRSKISFALTSEKRGKLESAPPAPHVPKTFWDQKVIRTMDQPPPVSPLKNVDIQNIFGEEFVSSLKTSSMSQIAQHPGIIEGIAKYNIPWGTQVRLAIGLNNGLWKEEDVLTNIAHLGGKDEDVLPKLASIMGKGVSSRDEVELGKILDQEQAAYGIINQANRVRAMWNLGSVQVIADYRLKDHIKTLKLVRIEHGERSFQFARDFGSRRFIHVKLHKSVLSEQELPRTRQFFGEYKFVVWGRVFVALPPKDNTVVLVEVREDIGRIPSKLCGDHLRPTFHDWLARTNPLAYNSNQSMAKYLARFALGFSTSKAALLLKASNIMLIDDIYTSDFDPAIGKKAEDHQIPTDGAGFINEAGLLKIAQALDIALPTAVQGRIAGCKGLWVLHPDDKTLSPRIWVRRSQLKIVLWPVTPSDCVFHLLAVSKEFTGRMLLSKQPLIILQDRKVPDHVLLDLQRQSVTEDLDPILDMVGSTKLPDEARLTKWLDDVGSVSRSIAQAWAGADGKVKGFGEREKSNVDDPDVDFDEGDVGAEEEDVDDHEVQGQFNPVTLEPCSLHEKIIALFRAGFHVSQCPTLNKELRKVFAVALKKMYENLRFPLPEGAGFRAFCAPDPTGLLPEGKIFYSFPNGHVHPVTRRQTNILIGEVLVGRFPMRLSSDLQKVEAVDIPELHGFPGVIFFSVRGKWSMANRLAGGDSDGDKWEVYLLADLVEPFVNHDIPHQKEGLLNEYFEGKTESVTDVLQELADSRVLDRGPLFLGRVLNGLTQAPIGIFSILHELATYEHGLGDRSTVTLAHVFAHVLDSSKSGLQLKAKKLKEARRDFNRPRPICLDPQKGDRKIKRPSRLKKFIIDLMYSHAKSLANESMKKYDAQITNFCEANAPLDSDLGEYWLNYWKPRLENPNVAVRNDLVAQKDAIENWVEEFAQKHSEVMVRLFDEEDHARAIAEDAAYYTAPKRYDPKKDRFTELQFAFHQSIPGVYLPEEEVKRLKVSRTYHKKGKLSLVLRVAWDTVLQMKAQGRGAAAITKPHAQTLAISKPFMIATKST